MEFVNIKTVQDTIPIVLIDYSYSTISVVNIYNNDINILKYEIMIAQKYFESVGIDEIYLMFWNSSVNIYSPNSIKVSTLDKIDIKPNGGTSLAPVLKSIPNNWKMNKSTIDLFIFTDGEICDGNEITEPLNELFKLNVKIQIITVEDNNNNYLLDNCNAGNTIYEIIRNNNLMSRVKKFSSYNTFHVSEPFISFNNPDVGPECAPFREKCFEIHKTYKFVNYIENIIDDLESTQEILKLAHDLTLTIFHIIKSKSLPIKTQIINMFSDLFSNKNRSVYKEVRKLFLDEIDNHSKGQSTTFQGYKSSREKVFETVQLSLFSNVKNSISSSYSSNYVSMIVNLQNNENCIIVGNNTSVGENLTLSDKIYNNSSLKIGKYHIPMLPCTINLDFDIHDQCIRQWIRAVYGKKYKLNPASDIIHYIFLADSFRILLSPISSEIKNAYEKLLLVMLNRKRFGTDIIEYDYLLNNPPSPLSSYDEEKIIIMFNNAIVHSKVSNVRPMTWWYGLIKCFNDKVLEKAQYPYCIEDMKKDSLDNNIIIDDNTVLEYIRNNTQLVQEFKYINNKQSWEYYCYISLDSTKLTGGYTVPPHHIGKKYICSPKFMLSPESYEFLNKNEYIGCPICHKDIKSNEFIFIEPEKEYLEKNNFDNLSEILIDEPFCNISLFENVIIDKSMYDIETEKDNILKTIDDCNFECNSFNIQSPYLQDPIGSRTIEIKTQIEFNNMVLIRYPFLTQLNWEGVCLAGGFCRSILLRQKFKDLDFFFYGQNYEINFRRFLREILDIIKKENDKIKFLFMYKHQFNVFEVICIHDPNNFFTDDYTLDNFDHYDFKSLHRYDKYTVIEPETGKIFRQKNKQMYEMKDTTYDDIDNRDFSNYFEDGDISGVRMKHRLQFVLTKNKNIGDLLSSFDMYPCRVVWDGMTTWLTEKSEFAYKYMINIINENNNLQDYRISKYFTYGFSIVLPELDLREILVNKKEQIIIGDLKFKINLINGNKIIVEHNSHLTEKIDSIIKLETKNLKNGKVLYKSSMFCSLVAILRYVKINDISYKITSDIIIPDINGLLNFEEKDDIIRFIDKIEHDKEKKVIINIY